MPRFSVIVPAYKVQAYLHACLASVLEQSCPDLELIAVDDCSPDACGSIIDEFAARDPRVRPVHLDEHKGRGQARNAGLERAKGDYLVFLDGSDTLTPHALHAIADRLKETEDPDVLVYDFARTFWTGETVRNIQAAQLTERGPAPFRLDDRPGLLKVLMVVGNKAYRREFIEREGLTFSPGHYEDTPWTYSVLMASETIATLDRVCVHFRQRRQGSTTGTPRTTGTTGTTGSTGPGHFDIFDQYDRVFAHLDAHPELAHWRPVLFRRMVDHLSAVFLGRDRLPRRSRPEFLRRARAHYARYRVPGARLPARNWLRHVLIRLGSHRTYRTLWAAAQLKRRVTEGVTAVFRAVRAVALRLHYRVQLRLPLRADHAVFSNGDGRGYGCNPAALEDAFRTYAPGIRTAWIAAPEHHHTVPTATRKLTPDTAAYWTALARSKYLVSNVDFDRRLVKRSGQILVQTQTGTPLKRMGLDLQDRPAAARGTDFAELLRGVDQWDYCLSGNRHSTLVWERVFPSGYTTLEYGQPRNDVFQRATSADVARLRETLGIPEGSVAILYAPTHRDYRRSQPSMLDLERILRQLGPRFVLLTRAHPSYGQPLARSGGGLIDVSGHPSVESLCLASDALITDFSSLMFDYANLDRPIVIHANDWAAYEAARGTYFDLRKFPPGVVARSEDELIDIFATGHWRGSRSAQLRAAFRERFCPYDDGRAAERVVRRVVLGETAGLPAVVPLDERHPVPSMEDGIPWAPDSTRTGDYPAASPLATVSTPGVSVPVVDTP
ncbi:bifunctional glycosyltransferase/CDP-glycerol:glycerophosphate glycerophosphotransferase [Streptomyces sp. NBC_00286]|uniref:bifunctional glycosyltransferase/CDP-glycerol:glycerophosphate glycerophosphotransferase n=1 Tax=Streptomyces sp. NBC_00286 TaxID=2975701 RepID=UPI002E28B5D8|nr:bifunctional glycosyltransferase family 2 protein/CDP-glycerol:glycerophosphate glycerophosphotransferase [Streptomyces sp. NBC_00286]